MFEPNGSDRLPGVIMSDLCCCCSHREAPVIKGSIFCVLL